MLQHLIVASLLTMSLLGGCTEQPPATEATKEQPSPPSAPARPDEPVPVPPPVDKPPLPVTSNASSPEQHASPCVTRLFLRDTVEPQLLELPTDALTAWRACREQKPILLLLSNNPLLLPVPEGARPAVTTLLMQGTPEQIATRNRPGHPDPLLLPSMAVDAALRLGWFNQLFWVIPLREANQEFSLDTFRKQLHDGGLANQGETDTFTLADKVFSGQLRAIPVTAAPLANLPELAGPVVVHIDLGYFEPLYKSEITTPLLPIIGSTFKALQARNLKVLAVTISRGNLDQSLSLDVRFLGEIIESLTSKPDLLDKELPVNWKRKIDILYLESLFQRDLINRKLLEMETSAPKDASVKFSLYRAAAEDKSGDKALEYLAKAVALDKVYALEYLSLSEIAYDRQRPDEAMRMLSLAGKAYPQNAQIKLKTAQLAQELGDHETAQHLVKQLRQLPWSPVYYPDMPAYLAGFSEFLNGPRQSKPLDDKTGS